MHVPLRKELDSENVRIRVVYKISRDGTIIYHKFKSTKIMSLLEREIVETHTSPTASVIWLHGLGADGHDFLPIVPQLNLPQDLALRFIFPHAPKQAVTINGGYVMRAWYDIAHPDLTERQDDAGVRASQKLVLDLIEDEVNKGIKPQRIVLAGFSQGGAIALHTALRYPQRLAGIMALSTYLPLADSFSHEAHSSNHSLPIMMAHGTQDPIVPISAAERSKQFLLRENYQVEWFTYPMAHSVCIEEISDIGDWLVRTIG